MNKQLTTELTTTKTSSGNGKRSVDVSAESAKAAAQRKSIVELIPQYILTVIGVIYAAGFLVMLSFLDRFGIRDPGNRLLENSLYPHRHSLFSVSDNSKRNHLR